MHLFQPLVLMRPRGWQVSLLNPLAVTQIVLSSVKLSLSLSQVDCFHASWDGTLLQSLMYFVLPKYHCILLKINLKNCCAFYFFRLCYFLILQFHKFLEPNKHFASKMDFYVHDSGVYDYFVWPS
jgi:hypothetical protein